jgi:hypothetical protein
LLRLRQAEIRADEVAVYCPECDRREFGVGGQPRPRPVDSVSLLLEHLAVMNTLTEG